MPQATATEGVGDRGKRGVGRVLEGFCLGRMRRHGGPTAATSAQNAQKLGGLLKTTGARASGETATAGTFFFRTRSPTAALAHAFAPI